MSRTRQQPLFRPLLMAAALLILGMVMAVHTCVASEQFLPALNLDAPALSRVSPVIEHAPPRLARRVVLVVIDGLRLNDSYGLPLLDRLRRSGVDASATSHYPTISRPNYITIATGVPPRASGVRTNYFGREVRLDSLMDRTRAAAMKSAYAGDHSNGLPEMFTRIEANDDGSPRYDSAFDDATHATWRGGMELTAERLAGADYPLVILLPGKVDEVGHIHGADSIEYRHAARQVDRMLERALAGYDLEHDTIIVTADHGHTDVGGHGGIEAAVMEVPLVMAGTGIRPGAAVVGARLVDIAPTVATLLGLPAPGHGVGRTLTETLAMDDDARDGIATADRRRIARNMEIVETWKAEARLQVHGERMWRVPLVMVLMVAAVLAVMGARRADALHIDWRVMVIALPAFPLTYYALIAVIGQQFSPSAIPEYGSLVSLLFRFGLVSTLAHIVMSWFAFRGRVVLTERLATANGLFLCGLLSSVVPLGLAWALLPRPLVLVPEPAVVVLVPATYVACACYAIAVVAMLGLEIVVFFSRAVDPRMRHSAGRGEPARLPGSAPL